MAFSDLDDELDNLRGGNGQYQIETTNDEGELEFSESTLDWEYSTLSSIIGGQIASAGPDVQDALRWVLQGSKQENYHIWEGARKLGVDLYALGVSPRDTKGARGFNESVAPSSQAMGMLYKTLGIDKVTQRKNESTKDFEIRLESARNWDVYGDMAGHADGDLMAEFLVGSGKHQIPVTKAIRNIATGFVKRDDFQNKKDYQLAVDKTARKLTTELPKALREQAKYYATRPQGSAPVGYHQILSNIGLGTFDKKKYELDFGDKHNLSSTLKDIGNVFNARGTGGADWHDLHTGLQSWMQPASNYKGGEVLDELARSGDENLLHDLANELSVVSIWERGVDPSVANFDTPVIDMADLNSLPDEVIQQGLNKVRGINTYRRVEADMAEIIRKKRRKIDPSALQTSDNKEALFTPKERVEIPTLPVEQVIPTTDSTPSGKIPAGYWREGDDELIIHNAPQGTQEWKNSRDPLLTAADAHIANPKSKYGAKSLQRKMETITGDNSIESRYNENFERGHTKESIARDWYEKKYGTPVAEVGLIENPKYQGIGASVDGLVGSQGLFEAKAPARKFFDLTKDHAYYAQVQMQMAVTNREWADLVQVKESDRLYLGKPQHEYKVDRVQRDEGFIRANMAKWQAHGQNFRIASGQATPEDEEFLRKQSEYSDWWNEAIPQAEESKSAAKREAFAKARRADHIFQNQVEGREADFEARLLERAKSPDASANLKEVMKSALVEADEEIQKKKSTSLLGHAMAMGEKFSDFMSTPAGKVLGGIGNFIGGAINGGARAFGSAGQGDYLGAVADMTGRLPFGVGALIGGTVTAVKGQLDKANEIADTIGTAKVLGLDYNAVNTTQQMGTALGISRQNATNMLATTTSAAQGMSTGNMDEASKIVTETRGYINLADLQAYGDNPIKLAQIAKARMVANGLTKTQQADLLRRAGLGEANKVEGATAATRENMARASTQNELTPEQAQLAHDQVGRANLEMSLSSKRPMIQMIEDGNIESLMTGIVTTVDFVEKSFTALATGAIDAGEGLGKLGDEIRSLLEKAGIKVAKPESKESIAARTSSGKILGVDESKLKPAASATSAPTKGSSPTAADWEEVNTDARKRLRSVPVVVDDGGVKLDWTSERKVSLKTTPAQWREALDELQSLKKSGMDSFTGRPFDKHSMKQLDQAISIAQSKVDVNITVEDKVTKVQAKQDGKPVASAVELRANKK